MNANNGVQVLVYNADYANSGTDNVTVTVNNITSSSGKVNYRSYLMDKTHSNSYQTWKTMGSPTIAAMSAANWNSLRAAMVLARIDSTDSMQLTNNSFSRAYTLSKEGVMLIMLTPSDAPTVIKPESAENRPAFNICPNDQFMIPRI
jgi:xylan 1,4-beta-xylosidase